MITIITVNKNNAEGLQKTIESVISQTYTGYEFVLIDGGSDDGSLDLMEKYKNAFHYCISESDTGIYNAMNKGILNSNGSYILFLNSGDWLKNSHVLEQAAPCLKIHDIISGDIDIYDQGKWHEMKSEDKITINLFFRLSLYHQATFVSRSLFKKHGLYNEEFKSTGDYEFFVRTLLKNNGSYCHIPLKISNFVANGMSNRVEFKELNIREWKKSWKINFSEKVFLELKDYYDLLESTDLMWGKRINKIIPF